MSKIFVASSAFLISERPFEKHPGTAAHAPYVDATVAGNNVKSERFKARIDTGADITCIPERLVDKLTLISGRSLLIRNHSGSIVSARSYILTVTCYGWPDASDFWTFSPKRGVLLSDSDVGLIGMDIISPNWKLQFDDLRFTVEDNHGENGAARNLPEATL